MPNKSGLAGKINKGHYLPGILRKLLTKTDMKGRKRDWNWRDIFWILTDAELLVLIALKKQN